MAGAPDAAPGEGTSLAPAPAPEVAYGGEGDSRAGSGRWPLSLTRLVVLDWQEASPLPICTTPTHVHVGAVCSTSPPNLAHSMHPCPLAAAASLGVNLEYERTEDA